MNDDLYTELSSLLVDRFEVPAERIRPDATLESLGMDSLTLMEFVFAAEDRFSVRVPEEQLDPRQAGVTLARLTDVLEEQLLRGSTANAQA